MLKNTKQVAKFVSKFRGLDKRRWIYGVSNVFDKQRLIPVEQSVKYGQQTTNQMQVDSRR